MRINEQSHIDHLKSWELTWLLSQEVGEGFQILTLKSPFEGLCDLRGPIMGDDPIPNGVWTKRPGRENLSRTCSLPRLQSSLITAIALNGVLITAYFGPLAPKEIHDPYLTADEAEASVAFWSQHALVLL